MADEERRTEQLRHLFHCCLEGVVDFSPTLVEHIDYFLEALYLVPMETLRHTLLVELPSASPLTLFAELIHRLDRARFGLSPDGHYERRRCDLVLFVLEARCAAQYYVEEGIAKRVIGSLYGRERLESLMERLGEHDLLQGGEKGK